MSENNPYFMQMTADKVGETLLAGLVQEIRIMPDCWQKLSENKQADVIDRLEKQVRNAVTLAVHMIASAERKTAYGKLESVAIKDKMKAVLVINQSSPCRHELLDAVEQDCLIILGGAEDHMGNIGGAASPDPDQNPLDLNGGDNDMDEPGAWGGGDGEIVDAEFTPLLEVEKFGGYTLTELALSISTKKETIDLPYLQSRYALSVEQATRVILLLLDDGVIVLEAEGETPDQHVYRVVKKPDEINME
ncbi:cell division protein FtsK [Pseudomonas paralcaligenes]|uniref:cell division protein FtsK n=1 Tax=Pseudomonas paralcaligenes TaxID=2772558 RepID=UPI001C81D3A9|nr:cell division protein FtsK [Pseudomonas paralcaligenes]